MKRLLTVTLLLFLVSNGVFGLSASVSSFHVELNINAEGVLTETLEVTLFNPYNESSDTAYILLYDAPYRLEISDGATKIMNFSVFLANEVYTVRIYDLIPANSSKQILLTYINDKSLQPIEEYYLLSYSFKSYYDSENFYVETTLPNGYGITKKGGISVSPEPSSLYSNGQQITVRWDDSIVRGETNNYILFFEKLSIPNIPLEGFIISGFIGFLAGFVLSQIISRRKRKEVITMTLSADEKKVVDLIANNNNFYQNDIEKSLDFSKPKLSKIIHILESKGILIVIPEGRKNKIELNKKMI